jgi:hypothetical protein
VTRTRSSAPTRVRAARSSLSRPAAGRPGPSGPAGWSIRDGNTASPQPRPAAGTRVGAFDTVLILFVGSATVFSQVSVRCSCRRSGRLWWVVVFRSTSATRQVTCPALDDVNGQSFCYGSAKTFGQALERRDRAIVTGEINELQDAAASARTGTAAAKTAYGQWGTCIQYDALKGPIRECGGLGYGKYYPENKGHSYIVFKIPDSDTSIVCDSYTQACGAVTSSQVSIGGREYGLASVAQIKAPAKLDAFVHGIESNFYAIGLAASGFAAFGASGEGVTAEGIIEGAAGQQASRGADYLRQFLSDAEQAAYDVNPARGSRFLGQAVHRATDAALQREFGDRFLYQTLGPDFVGTGTGEMLELTTPGQVGAHMLRPGYEGVTYVRYLLGGSG